MSDAPDQIWIDRNGGNWSPCSGGTQDVEYRRADLPPTLSAAMELPEVKALVEAAWSVNHDNLHGNGLEGFRKNRDRLRVTLENLDAALAAVKEYAHTEYERKVAQMKKDFPNGI